MLNFSMFGVFRIIKNIKIKHNGILYYYFSCKILHLIFLGT